MSTDRADTAAKDGWVSFSDILLTLVCAVLFVRSTISSQRPETATVQQFEERLQVVVREAEEIDASLKVALENVKVLANAIGKPPRDQSPSPRVE
jgi:hypothetical protein